MWQKNVRYLDYNAGSGLSDYVQQKLIETLQSEVFFANPSSRHRLGQRMQHFLYSASLKVARSFGEGVTPDHLLFTSSGTEANQTVIRSVLQEVQGMPKVGMIIGTGEHSATYDLIDDPTLVQNRWVRTLSLLPSGQYDFSSLQTLFAEAAQQEVKRVFLSLFWANNETGVLTDLPALAAAIKTASNAHGLEIILHLDGAQVWGKIPLDLLSTPAQYVTFSSHKIGAPAGTGVIWARDRHQKTKAFIMGSQSHGLRGGTENGFGILATGFGAEAATEPHALQHFVTHTGALQKLFESELHRQFKRVKMWGEETIRVSNTSRLSFPDFHSYENWVELLDLRGFAVSHGSACKSNVIEPSRVLLDMGASKTDALNSIRVSFGPKNTVEDVHGVVAALMKIHEEKMSKA